MSESFAAPRTIRRIAARRVFQSSNGRPVVLTLGVPRPVPRSDWGCPLQITGLNSTWRRPRYVFGMDGFQALQLAMQCAAAVLEASKVELAWLGQHDTLGMPRFLPELLPKPQQDRIEFLVEREMVKFVARAKRRSQVKASRSARRRK